MAKISDWVMKSIDMGDLDTDKASNLYRFFEKYGTKVKEAAKFTAGVKRGITTDISRAFKPYADVSGTIDEIKYQERVFANPEHITGPEDTVNKKNMVVDVKSDTGTIYRVTIPSTERISVGDKVDIHYKRDNVAAWPGLAVLGDAALYFSDGFGRDTESYSPEKAAEEALFLASHGDDAKSNIPKYKTRLNALFGMYAKSMPDNYEIKKHGKDKRRAESYIASCIRTSPQDGIKDIEYAIEREVEKSPGTYTSDDIDKAFGIVTGLNTRRSFSLIA